MFYHLLKAMVRNETRHFFREITVKGEPQESGPVILVANHPNVMLDAALILCAFRRDIWTVAKGGMFKGRVQQRVLRWFRLLPVYRRSDSPDQMSKNERAFEAVIERLRMGDAVLVFPEGQSFAQRTLLKIKTGAARMALQGVMKEGSLEHLTVQPVGITYSEFFRFHSSVTLTFGEPIAVAPFASQPEEEGVQQLTTTIEDALRSLIVEVAWYEAADVIEMVDKLYSSQGEWRDDRERMAHVMKISRALDAKDPALLEGFRRRLELHFQLCNSLKFDGSEDIETRHWRLFYLLLLPIAAIGIALLFVPYKVSFALSEYLATRKAQYSSLALSLALILFPLWQLFLACVVYGMTGELLWSLAMIVFCLGAGYLIGKHANCMVITLFDLLWPGSKTPLQTVRDMRDQLLQEIEHLAALGVEVREN